MATLEEKIKRVLAEQIELVAYDSRWPELFQEEKQSLLALFPDIIRRVEHIGSTAVPGLVSKPIVDMLVQVSDLQLTRRTLAPVLEEKGYDYFWRPTWGENTPPFYAWFIKRDGAGRRTHHIHMVEADFPHWERTIFRDYLIKHREVAKKYEELKLRLARQYADDRVAYTKGKTEFIVQMTAQAKAALSVNNSQ